MPCPVFEQLLTNGQGVVIYQNLGLSGTIPLLLNAVWVHFLVTAISALITGADHDHHRREHVYSALPRPLRQTRLPSYRRHRLPHFCHLRSGSNGNVREGPHQTGCRQRGRFLRVLLHHFLEQLYGYVFAFARLSQLTNTSSARRHDLRILQRALPDLPSRPRHQHCHRLLLPFVPHHSDCRSHRHRGCRLEVLPRLNPPNGSYLYSLYILVLSW
jgi:hypothetical protein